MNPRAGILILYKKKLNNHINFYPTNQNLVVFFKLKASILSSSLDLICGCVYIPPSGSLYAKPDDFETLQTELLEIRLHKNCNILLLGDFNAKTKTLPDFIETDKFDSSLFYSDDAEHVDTTRYNQDLHEPDDYGHNLINLCKVQNLLIVNGRLGKDHGLGKFTTRNNSLIDYCLASPELFKEINIFDSLDT